MLKRIFSIRIFWNTEGGLILIPFYAKTDFNNTYIRYMQFTHNNFNNEFYIYYITRKTTRRWPFLLIKLIKQ